MHACRTAIPSASVHVYIHVIGGADPRDDAPSSRLLSFFSVFVFARAPLDSFLSVCETYMEKRARERQRSSLAADVQLTGGEKSADLASPFPYA